MIITATSAAPRLSSSVGLTIGGLPGNYLDIKRSVYRYTLYYQYILSSLSNALALYSKGEVEKLSEQYSSGQLKSIALQNVNFNLIYAERIDAFLDTGDAYDYLKETDDALFENYKILTGNILTGFGHSIEKNKLLISTEQRAYELQAILDTPTLLEKYIQERRNITHFAFDAMVPLQLSIQIKPWFRDYLRLHGPPYDGVFDAQKMALVVQNLINSGEITAEDFIQATV